MQYLPKGTRVWSVDLLRGVYLLVIMIAHSIFFFHSDQNVLLIGINTLADTISFTGLLFVSGITAYIAYIHREHSTYDAARRIFKRLAIYLLGYYLLAIAAHTMTNGWSLDAVIDIVLFFRLVPFTEFILAFLIFGILKLPLRSILRLLARSWVYAGVVGLLLFMVGSYFAGSTTLVFPTGWKAILVGEPGWYSFPVFQYAIVYLFGLVVGRQFSRHTSKKEISHTLIGLTAMASLVVGISAGAPFFWDISLSNVFLRFPPSFAFIFSGLAIASASLWVILQLHQITRVNSVRIFFLLLGQNAFALFFAHTFIVYTYVAMGFPALHSSILVVILMSISVLLALYIARVIPLNYRLGLSFIDWCECQLGECSHGPEYHQQQLARAIHPVTKISRVFSFQVGRRRFKLIRARHFTAALVGILLIAAPLGIAENNLIIESAINNSSGTINRNWVLQDRNTQLEYTYTLPDELAGRTDITLRYQLNEETPQPMRSGFNLWTATIKTQGLASGEYKIKTLVTVGSQTHASEPTTIQISYPVYVTWTIDWEGYDAADSYLDALITISEQYRQPMTHLFNPRIYSSADIGATRSAYLTQWVKNRRDLYQEEIGLHLHMFPDFVEQAGVEPKTEPAWGGGFSPGYDILTTAYDQDEMQLILEHAIQVFAEKDLGRPRSYRAGAWFANSATLRALEATGFLVDSSGRTKYSFGTNQIPGFWDLPPTAQPYYPSRTDQNQPATLSQLDLLEVPNNGADSFAFSAAQMIDRFEQNYSGGTVSEPFQVTFLSHPHWFHAGRQDAMRQVFAHIDQYRYDQDKGPVVPTTLIGIYKAWEQE